MKDYYGDYYQQILPCDSYTRTMPANYYATIVIVNKWELTNIYFGNASTRSKYGKNPPTMAKYPRKSNYLERHIYVNQTL